MCISVLIPLKGYKLIPKTIGSVLSQKCEDYEIWILRNDITDLPKGIDAEERETVSYGENITIKELLIRDCGKGNALNEGIKRANGDIIAVVDADCILQEGALKTAVKHFANDAVAAVGGRLLVMIEDESLLEKIQSFEYMKSFQFARRIWNKLHAQCLISGAFGLFRKRDLLEIGGYDTDTVGEDMEVVLRLQNDGYRRTSKQIVYEPNALCATGVPHNMKKLLRQRDRWQRGLIDCLSKHHMMILNPNYALLGILTLGYQLGFEMMGPLLCTAGLGYILWT